MRAGALRHRITIEQPAGTVDTFGEQDDTWTTVATVWGSLEAAGKGGSEGSQQERMEAVVSYEVHLRYRGSLTPGMRLTLGSRHFDVVSVADLEGRGRELVLICKEVV